MSLLFQQVGNRWKGLNKKWVFQHSSTKCALCVALNGWILKYLGEMKVLAMENPFFLFKLASVFLVIILMLVLVYTSRFSKEINLGSIHTLIFENEDTRSMQSSAYVHKRIGSEYDAAVAAWVAETYNGSNCSVQTRDTTECTWSKPVPMCSLGLLRKFRFEHHSSVDSGYWTTGRGHLFCPSVCTLATSTVEQMRHWKVCRRSTASTKITILGESTAHYLTHGLISTLENWNFNCFTHRKEGKPGTRDPSYFKIGKMSLMGLRSFYRAATDLCFAQR